MEPCSSSRLKRKSSDQEVRDHLQNFLKARKMAKGEDSNGSGPLVNGTFGPTPNPLNDGDKKKAFIVRISPLHLDLPQANFDHQDLNQRLNDYKMTTSEDNGRLPFFLQNMSVDDDDNEPRRLFTLYDIKNDDTSKTALDAKKRLRYTNVHGLICPQEKMFLTTACDYFLADYDDLIDYIDAIGEMRNKQIIVEHCYYKLFMHTLKMFYYTDKGWRFNIEFDEFFSGYLRKYREPIIEQMTRNWNNAKKAAQAARQAARQAALTIETEQP